MFKNKLLRVLLVVGLFVTGGGVGVGVLYDSYVDYHEVQIQKQMHQDLIMPIIRVKGKVELPDGRVAKWTGSGVVVYSKPNETKSGYDTYVLTCNHCVEVPVWEKGADMNAFSLPPPKRIKYEVDYVEMFDQAGNSARKVPGRVVAQSNNNIFKGDDNGDLAVDVSEGTDELGLKAGEDLALIRLDTVDLIPAVKILSRDRLDEIRLFKAVRVVGCSLGGKPYHTQGEITMLEETYLGINAQFVPGNSGGACYLDNTFEFIGITNAGPNGVWHMGLVRPLSRIYNWFDKVHYNFIYDKNIPDAERFVMIRKENDQVKMELQNRMRELEKMQQLCNELTQTVANLQNDAKGNEQKIGQLLALIDDLQKKIKLLEDQLVALQNAPKVELPVQPEKPAEPEKPVEPPAEPSVPAPSSPEEQGPCPPSN